MKKRRKGLTEADIRALTALRRGAFVQTPEDLRCLPVEPTPEERARALAEHEAWMGGGAVPAEELIAGGRMDDPPVCLRRGIT